MDHRNEFGSDLKSFDSNIRDPRVRGLLHYWLSKRGDRRIPLRTDIEPTEIPELLPFVFLMDVDRAARRFRVRLAGTAICNAYHRNITGEDFENVVSSDVYKIIHSDFCDAAFALNIHHVINNFDFEKDSHFYERIVFPTLNSVNEVDVLIGLFVTTFKSEGMPFSLSEILSTARSTSLPLKTIEQTSAQ
ncbi:PAS domain-containing protein [Pelagibius sp. Alg239-R121]|uniref:PAS domain-containing protein n=1 Tax=Pelagibius sp. Alg239-R121 TaxID=2993448 RepID=UPI0024A62077|nr:PAS domain-containing protein [Pelagibius sp. Alg239-R121]